MPRDLVEYPEVQTRPDLAPVDEDGALLLRTAEIIEERGWCQWTYGLHGGPVCATGAAMEAGIYDIWGLNKRLGFTGVDRSWLTFWNDEEGRTKAEVLALFRSAAHAVPR